jgi:hypothetical protein
MNAQATSIQMAGRFFIDLQKNIIYNPRQPEH